MTTNTPTPAEAVGVIIFALLLGFIGLGFTAWIVMLLLGALGSELGFTGPSYFVTFAGVWLLKIIAGWFTSTGSKSNG